MTCPYVSLNRSFSMKSSECAILNTLILLVNNNSKYKNILRETGLVDVMIVALQRYATSLRESNGGEKKIWFVQDRPIYYPANIFFHLLVQNQ